MEPATSTLPITLITEFAGSTVRPASLRRWREMAPPGVAVDAAGGVYIADASNYRLRFIDFATPQVTIAARANVGVAAGTASVAITVSPAGALWSATSNVPWLTVTSGSATGSGAIT